MSNPNQFSFGSQGGKPKPISKSSRIRSPASSRPSSRETSPLRSTSILLQNPSKIPIQDDPILEDDEQDTGMMVPMLPVFSKEGQDSVDSGLLETIAQSNLKHNEADTPVNRKRIIEQEIEGDFDQEFYKDTGIKKKLNPAATRTSSQENGLDLGDPDSSEDEATDDEISTHDQNDSNDKELESTPYNTDNDNNLTQDAEYPEYNSKSEMIRSLFRRKEVNKDEDELETSVTQNNSTPDTDIASLKSQRQTFIERLFHLGSNSVFPGGTRVADKSKIPDEEEQLLDGYGLHEAKGMVGQHIPMEDLKPSFSVRSQGSQETSATDSFLFTPVRHELEFDEFAQDHESLPNRVRTGITSSLMHLYNPLNSNTSNVFSDSDVDATEPEFGSRDDFTDSDVDDSRVKNSLKKKIKSLKMYAHQGSSSDLLSPRSSFEGLPASTQHQKPQHKRTFSGNSLSNLLLGKVERRHSNPDKVEMPKFSRSKSEYETNESKKKQNIRNILKKKIKKNNKTAARITVHIADFLQRQVFILKLCKAFMQTGFPNHRLETYMSNTARVLEIDASFIYLPGCMIVSFGDPATRTSEVKLVRVTQGLDLGKLDEAHEIYKSVVHDRIEIDFANQKLDELLARKPYFNTYWSILLYGLSSNTVIPWAFGGSWMDLIPTFVLGCLLGFLQLVVAPKSSIYSAVFEVSSSVWLSFIGRAVGSIGGGEYFCFSAVVQGGLCMILPGYIILSGALELQSRSLVAGSVRMFYAIIYSLFLGFGLTLGSALYGWIDKNATTNTSCKSNIPAYWNIFFVPVFTIVLSLASQAQWHQISIMTIIACGGYTVSYFSGKHFNITEFNSALGSFTIGIMSHLYTRTGVSLKKIGYCSTTFCSMLSGVFDLVPGGVASRNVLSAGIKQLQSNQTSTSLSDSTLSFGITMVEIAIGITVGLFFAELVVYPFGNKQSASL